MSRCSFHAEAERDRPSSMLLKSAVGRYVIFETDTQVDPAQTAETLYINETGTYFNIKIYHKALNHPKAASSKWNTDRSMATTHQVDNNMI